MMHIHTCRRLLHVHITITFVSRRTSPRRRRRIGSYFSVSSSPFVRVALPYPPRRSRDSTRSRRTPRATAASPPRDSTRRGRASPPPRRRAIERPLDDVRLDVLRRVAENRTHEELIIGRPRDERRLRAERREVRGAFLPRRFSARAVAVSPLYIAAPDMPHSDTPTSPVRISPAISRSALWTNGASTGCAAASESGSSSPFHPTQSCVITTPLAPTRNAKISPALSVACVAGSRGRRVRGGAVAPKTRVRRHLASERIVRRDFRRGCREGADRGAARASAAAASEASAGRGYTPSDSKSANRLDHSGKASRTQRCRARCGWASSGAGLRTSAPPAEGSGASANAAPRERPTREPPSGATEVTSRNHARRRSARAAETRGAEPESESETSGSNARAKSSSRRSPGANADGGASSGAARAGVAREGLGHRPPTRRECRRWEETG